VTSVLQEADRAGYLLLVFHHNPAPLRRATLEMRGAVAIRNEHQVGLSGARNTGVRAATSDIVAFLDDDAFAAPNWLAALVAAYTDPDVVGVGGRVLPAWRAGRPAWFPPEFDWVVGCSYRGMPVERAQLIKYNGTNMSVRRQLLLDSGGFDGTELRSRLQRRQPHGLYVYEPAAMVRLGVPRSLSTWSYFRSRCFSAGMSKALVDGRVGPALATDRWYLRSVISTGIGRSAHSALRGNLTAAHTAVVLSAGVAITSAGYVNGRARSARHRFAKATVHRDAQRPQCSSVQFRASGRDQVPVACGAAAMTGMP